MKRKIALFILLFANSILLMHAAIPHHNHEGLFCLIEPTEKIHHHCEDSHEHLPIDHTENHPDKNNNLVDCELNVDIIIPANERKAPGVIVIDIVNRPFLSIDLLVENHFNNALINFYLDKSDQIPILKNAFQVYIICSKGLRAPTSIV